VLDCFPYIFPAVHSRSSLPLTHAPNFISLPFRSLTLQTPFPIAVVA
jgi:hypothetical protein